MTLSLFRCVFNQFAIGLGIGEDTARESNAKREMI